MENQNQETQYPESPNKKSGSSLKTLIIIIAALAIIAYFVQKNKAPSSSDFSKSLSSTNQSYQNKPSISSLFEIKTNKTSLEYGTLTIIGEVKNISTRPFKFVEVKVIFYDLQNRVVGEDTTYACGTDYISPGGVKSFKFMVENQSDYKRLNCEVIDYSEVD